MPMIFAASSHLRERVRNIVTPRFDEIGWAPLWNLMYLLFLLVNWSEQPLMSWLPATLIGVAVFLPVYFNAYRHGGYRVLFHSAAIAAIGFALTPFNFSANTFLVYSAVFLTLSRMTLRWIIVVIAVGLAVYSIQLHLLGIPPRYLITLVGITGLISFITIAASHLNREKRLRQAEFKLSHDEIRRLAALAERERIGRDLHDLLGHTLSLITLKSELASRLFDRDPPASRREILDVERVARDALGQVRRAVTGIRTAGLAAELASARLLLESNDVRLDYVVAPIAIPADIETVLALTVREAVTNIQRHAHAEFVRIVVSANADHMEMRVEDNGRGAEAIVPGNGLTGMRERLQALGGHLEIHAARGQGTHLFARVPLRLEDGVAQTSAVHV